MKPNTFALTTVNYNIWYISGNSSWKWTFSASSLQTTSHTILLRLTLEGPDIFFWA